MSEKSYNDIDMALEEQIVIEELGKEFFIESSSEDKKEMIKEKSKAVGDKLKKAGSFMKNLAKSIYVMKDEDFVNRKFTAVLSRIIVRGVIIGAAFHCSIVVGVIAFCTNKFIKQKVDEEQTSRLLDYYRDKLGYLNEKIEKEDNPEKKYQLIKIKREVTNSIHKLNKVNGLKTRDMYKSDGD